MCDKRYDSQQNRHFCNFGEGKLQIGEQNEIASMDIYSCLVGPVVGCCVVGRVSVHRPSQIYFFLNFGVEQVKTSNK